MMTDKGIYSITQSRYLFRVCGDRDINNNNLDRDISKNNLDMDLFNDEDKEIYVKTYEFK